MDRANCVGQTFMYVRIPEVLVRIREDISKSDWTFSFVI